VRVQQNELFQDPLFRRFFGLPDSPNRHETPTERFQAAGSGVIIDSTQGYVITNNHVVDRAEKIQIILRDRRRLDAEVVGTDPQTDIAVLKVQPDRLTVMPMGESRFLQVGDYVVAIGNPFGIGQSATFGIVSALGRTGLGIESYEDFIQTDASINPGNSGGALVDTNGRLIGINAAILSRSGGNVGVGFAIPIDLANAVIRQLIASGKVSRGSLGVTVQDLTPDLATAMALSVDVGAVVSQVVPQSAAAKAGVEDGDVITALDGEPVTGSSQLRNAIGQKQPGTAVRLSLLRDGRQRTVTATLDPLPASATASSVGSQEDEPLSGMSLGPIPRDDPNFGKVRGAYVASVAPGSAAESAGIREGDIIITAGRMPVASPADFARIMRQRDRRLPLLLQVRRGESSLYAALG
jgi:serine protease Do/serine protease DegQ